MTYYRSRTREVMSSTSIRETIGLCSKPDWHPHEIGFPLPRRHPEIDPA